MHQRRARAVGQIAFAVVAWLSSLPVVSADCNLSNLFGNNNNNDDDDDDDDGSDNDCGLSRGAMIGLIIACVVVAVSLIICGVCLRQRRLRRRMVNLSQVPYNGAGGWSPNPPKPHSAPVPVGYPTYHQATSPAAPPAHLPQYPPGGYDTYHNYSRSQPTSGKIPEPSVPVSRASMHAPSSTIPRPISSLDTPSLPLQSSVHRDEPTRIEPPPPSSPALPDSTQTNVVESPPSPSMAIPPTSALSPHSPGATPLLNAARPSALAPLHTGSSKTMGMTEQPPPAYTPIG